MGNAPQTTHAKLAARSQRRCATHDCPNRPEPKDDYCLACQLAGKAPDTKKP